MLTERADAFVVLLLPVAMREKHDIASYLPITEALKNNLEKDYIPTLCQNDKTLYAPKIFAETENALIGGTAVGTANSLGVDSFYTIYKYANCDDENLKITHFYMGAVSLDLWRTHSKNIFEYLKKKGLIEQNYAKSYGSFQEQKELPQKEKSIRFQTLEEFELFLSVVDDEFWKIFFKFG